MKMLGFGYRFEDLYNDERLRELDAIFLERLAGADEGLHRRLLAAREHPESIRGKQRSSLLLQLAGHVEDFLADLFFVHKEMRAIAEKADRLGSLFECKRRFIKRLAKTPTPPDTPPCFDGWPSDDVMAFERTYAEHVLVWLLDRKKHEADLEQAERYALWALHHPKGKAKHQHGVLFCVPSRIDPEHLIDVQTEACDGISLHTLAKEKRRLRDGFSLTDPGWDFIRALDAAHYCIWCHEQERDSCSKGMRRGGAFQRNAHGILLTGCPLEQNISEMNWLMARGRPVGALAVVTVDNPMVAGTGHRICNECMKACIYQKQDPVDIPQIETRMLREVLALPWGFEIYSLLTRFNPLNLRRPYPRPDSGKRVLVVGLGPSGYTLAHHLLQSGHVVVGIDGLKIEPLPAELNGMDESGRRVPFRPIIDASELYEDLGERILAGFGGVAEYGITVRWDKNFLKLIRLLLERRRNFRMYGAVRFGGTITIEDAFELGFDHIALCTGAGKPTFISIPNATAPGVRMASDFLMALQLTGAAKASSVANLQIRLPVVVIGGGLTAIDAATEALAYYPVQVEKFLQRYERLVAELGEDAVKGQWNACERQIAEEFIAHAQAIRQERREAAKQGRPPAIQSLLDQWGGATIAYRRRLIDAPCYILNHEEVKKAMEEGIRFAELLSPEAVEVDEYGHACSLTLSIRERMDDGRFVDTGRSVQIPARTILMAAGTHPNTILAEEDPSHLKLSGHFYQTIDTEGREVETERCAKPTHVHFLTYLDELGRGISFFGDLHPSYAGNVVKAMASAKRGVEEVNAVLARRPGKPQDTEGWFKRLHRLLKPEVVGVQRLTHNIVEARIRAPLAARNFRPGQFFRLQNFETLAPWVDGTRLAMEGVALTGAEVEAGGVISLIVLEMGGSSDLCVLLREGEPVPLMGPTGSPTEIPAGSTALLIGGGLGNAVLFSIGLALRKAGSKVLYFAAYKTKGDRFKAENIEAASDALVWCCESPPGFTPTRPSDKAFIGNVVEAMSAYAAGRLGHQPIPFSEVDRVIVIGSAGMMAAVRKFWEHRLRAWLKPGHTAIASINSPMQCMMKGICAQCIQTQRDPKSRSTRVVFSCANQDQPLDWVDFDVLIHRLEQQATQEKLTRLWIRRCLQATKKAQS